MAGAQSRSWTWRFDHAGDRVWPILADTQRFNEAAGLPKYRTSEVPQPDGSVEFYGAQRFGFMDIEWREIPVNWVKGKWFEHRREFLKGPLKSLTAAVVIQPENGGSSATYTLTAEPANLLGEILLSTGFFRSTEKTFARLANEVNEYLAGRRDEPFAYRPPEPSEQTKARVGAIVKSIEATPNGHGLGERLADFVLQAQEVDLWRIRPLALARRWGVRPIDAIEACLQAVREGLLELRWDLLCPRCRVAKAWSGGLDQLPTGAHCSSCNIDYGRDFSRNVEASFHPAPAIRRLDSGEYCMWGPMSVPHVVAQVALRPGEVRTLPGCPESGPYRLRTLAPGAQAEVDVDGQGFPTVIFSDNEVETGALAQTGTIRLENHSNRPVIAVIEDRRWVDDALTGDRLTALQGYRDLFALDVLRPGDEVAVKCVALLFSDLQGSTELYQRIGDAPAYHLVREHFALLAQSVREHEGAIVKTIGDAVMAAFADTAQAMEAAVDILKRIERFNADRQESMGGAPDIVIKLGVHAGPAIVVTLNDRLDYFGSAVNLAARLQGLAQGGEIVVSADALAAAGVEERIRDLKKEHGRAELKGFSHSIPILRCRN